MLQDTADAALARAQREYEEYMEWPEDDLLERYRALRDSNRDIEQDLDMGLIEDILIYEYGYDKEEIR